MAPPRLGIEIATDYNSAGFKEADANAKTFGVTVDQVAAKNIERTLAQKVRLTELAAQYKLVAASAKEGSAEQVAALDLAAKAQKRLGVEVVGMNSAVRTSARETALAEKELAKFTRGAAEATGTFGKLGLGLALGSGGFIAGAALTGGVKKAIDDAKALMDAEEQLTVAAKNTGQALDPKQLDAYLKAESDLSLFTKTDLVANLVQLERTTGSVTKAQQDEKLAANLARGAHIDLATATQDIINLEGGRTRGLVTLGVKIPIIKTATDALTASGLKFTGQQKAEAAALDKAAIAADGKRILLERYHGSSKKYAESDAAATDKLRVAENLLSTSIGTVLLPVVKEIADPFAKWAQKEADSGDAAKKTKELVGDLTGVLKDAKGVIHDVDKVTGGFKHTLEILAAFKFTSMVVGWMGNLDKLILKWGAVTTEAEIAGAAQRNAAGATFGGLSKAGLIGAAIGLAGVGITDAMTHTASMTIKGLGLKPTGAKGVYEDPNQSGKFHYVTVSAQGQTSPVSAADVAKLGLGASATSAGASSRGDMRGAGAAGNVATGRAKLLNFAYSMLGTPYAWGGTTPGGFDCSGLVQWAFGQSGINLPHVTTDQFKLGTSVSLPNIKKGDVVFTEPGKGPGGGPGHEGIYAGNGKVVEAPHTGDVVKTVSLSSFLSGGLAGIRDFMGGTSADSGTNAQAAALAAILAKGTKKPVKPKITSGSRLISDSLNSLINTDKNNATDTSGSVAEMWLKRELVNLKDARAQVAAKLKGASPKQTTAINAELRTIDTSIAGVNKAITTNLKAQATAIKSSAAQAITADKQAITAAFSNIITDAQTAFSAATQSYIDNTLGPQFSQGGLLTAKEQQYADMQAADTAQSLVDGLTQAQQTLADDMNGSLIEHVVDVATGNAKDIFGPTGTPQQVALDKQAVAQAQRMIDENSLSIDATAQRKDADKSYANAVTQYQQQRSVAEHAMTTDLTELGKEIADGKASIGDLPGVLGKYGLTTGDIMLTTAGQFGTDLSDLGAATQALAKVMADEAAALARIGDGKDAAAIQAVADSIGFQTPVSPGQSSVTAGLGGSAGYFLLNPIPHAAMGANVLRDGLIYAHAGEKVQPADVAAYSGGGSTIHFHVHADNYVGSQQDLARVIKSPAIVEAVSTAVLMGNRRGHIRASQLN